MLGTLLMLLWGVHDRCSDAAGPEVVCEAKNSRALSFEQCGPIVWGAEGYSSTLVVRTVTGASPLRLRHAPWGLSPVLTREDVSDVRAMFVADPFLLRLGDRWHMFFEVYNFDADCGQIAWATSKNGFAWSYQEVVLGESLHLSYPYVLSGTADII